MRHAEVYRNNSLAGILSETDNGGYTFTYDSTYYNDKSKPCISLTLPKTQLSYSSEHLFPFFFNMISEGANRAIQSKQLKIDENDFFGLLLATAKYDAPGAVKVKKIE